MERKIGETFEYEGKTFRVKENENYGCHSCFFYKRCTLSVIKMAGQCDPDCREDNKDVVFVEIQEQPHVQAEQPQLNLCEILKHCPQGETFWSPMLDGVKFSCIDEERQMIIVETIEGHFTWEINADGTISIDEVTSPEIMLYPTREQRDWSKFTAPWYKKEKFNPKTLKPFDKVLSRYDGGCWSANLFSHIEEENNKYHGTCSFVCNGSLVKFCIPYNDGTKHLVGTKDEAPDFYRYWED